MITFSNLGEILLKLAAQKMGRGRSDGGKIVINKCRESFTLDCFSFDCVKILGTVNYWLDYYSIYRAGLSQPLSVDERAGLKVTVATNIWKTGSYSSGRHLIWSLFQSDICFCLFVKTHLFQLNLHNKKYNDQLWILLSLASKPWAVSALDLK